MKQTIGAVIVAAGNSTRMGTGQSKVLQLICGKPAIWYSLVAFAACSCVREVVIVCREEDRAAFSAVASPFSSLVVSVVPGGKERQDSVQRGAEALSDEVEVLVIHDGARPMVTPQLIECVCADAARYGAATAAVPSKDTCKLGVDFVEETPPRDRLYAVQTPQAFQKELYFAALAQAKKQGKAYTDDCQLVEAAGGKVRLTPGDYRNIKLTTPEDLAVAEVFAKGRSGMRIGYGYDVHRLVEGRRLILGGVEIPHETGLLGHSDADVLVHAIADALLGAAALGDIGHLFPDHDPTYEGADSLVLLSQVCQLLREHGFSIGNVDATVMAQRPKLAPYILQMRRKIAAACAVEEDQISVKATTEEGLGFTGACEGMSAAAVALIF